MSEPMVEPVLTDDERRHYASLYNVPLELSIEIGRREIAFREVLELGPGSLVALERMVGEPVDLLLNGVRIAVGEVIDIDGRFGLRVTSVRDPEERRRAASGQAG